MDDNKLNDIIRKIRKDIILQTRTAASGHPGGSLSGVEILAVLYFEVMNIPDFQDEARDRFVLSKGHATPLLYATLAARGAFPANELTTFRQIDSRLQGHPDMNKTPGVDMSTGSLGLGTSAAVGMALSAKAFHSGFDVYCLTGDGELQEGVMWEAFMAAGHYGLDNLTVIVDNNGLQIDGRIDDVMSPNPIDKKLEAFGFYTQLIDGHDIPQIREAFANAKQHKGSPKAIVAKTVKGRGVSFMENSAEWHGKAPNSEEAERACAELEGQS